MSENARKPRSASSKVATLYGLRVLAKLNKGELAMLAALLDLQEFCDNHVKVLKQVVGDFNRSQFGANANKTAGGES